MAFLAAAVSLSCLAAAVPAALASATACGEGDHGKQACSAGGDESALLQRAGLRDAAVESGLARGCGSSRPHSLVPGKRIERSIRVQDTDANIGTTTRKYAITLPKDYTGKQRLPVLLFFHGWCDSPECDGCHWDELASTKNFIMVYPYGKSESICRSWNVGSGGKSGVCVTSPQDAVEYEYESCKKAGATGPCNTYTCVDDVAFVNKLVLALQQELCIDEHQIYGSGSSNGGIFLYYLVPQLALRKYPVRIAAAVSFSGGVFQSNEQPLPSSLRNVSVYELHGRGDRTVPLNGGQSNDGFLYRSTRQTLGAYILLKRCAKNSRKIETRFDGRKGLRQCYEFLNCKAGGRVAYCEFDSGHYLWPSYAEDMAWWLLRSSRHPGV